MKCSRILEKNLKNKGKATKTMLYFICYLAAPRPTLRPLARGNLDVNHCVLPLFDLKLTGNYALTLGS